MENALESIQNQDTKSSKTNATRLTKKTKMSAEHHTIRRVS